MNTNFKAVKVTFCTLKCQPWVLMEKLVVQLQISPHSQTRIHFKEGTFYFPRVEGWYNITITSHMNVSSIHSWHWMLHAVKFFSCFLCIGLTMQLSAMLTGVLKNTGMHVTRVLTQIS